VKEYPILFSTGMVRAILDGRKTQTRRVIPIKLQQCRTPEDEPEVFIDWCNYGHIGDHLWVKETFANAPVNGYVYRADYKDDGFGSEVIDFSTGMLVPLVWKSSRFMPHVASRITLEIVNVRVERVQDITPLDAVAEGCSPDQHSVIEFKKLWNSINLKRGYGWDVNPFVWCISFRRIEESQA